MKEAVLLSHVFFGVACLVSAVWLFVDVLNARAENASRIRAASLAVAICMWSAFLIGGYWYVVDYPADKSLILSGPFPAAHNFFMETKEHFVITLLLLTTYLPIAASGDLVSNIAARRLVLWVTASIAALALLAEGQGGIIALGVKLALLPHSH